MTIDDLVFVGLNGHVVAMDRRSGEIVWSKVHLEGGYLSLLLDGDLLAVSSHGYVYCLDPLTGDLLWENPLEGKGTGVACIVSVRGQNPSTVSTQASAQAAAAVAAEGAAGWDAGGDGGADSGGDSGSDSGSDAGGDASS
jgi:outer membrane protein assembly factor BamB